MNYKIFVTATTISVVAPNGITYQVNKEDEAFSNAKSILSTLGSESSVDEINEAAKAIIKESLEIEVSVKDETKSVNPARYAKVIVMLKKHLITIEEDCDEINIFYDGEPIEDALYDLIYVALTTDSVTITSLDNFLDKMFNTTFDLAQITEICNFMLGRDANVEGRFNITEEGNLILFKGVSYNNSREFPVDSHTGRIPQLLNVTYEMDRRLVDRDSNRTCSHGLHVATRRYAERFSNTVLYEVEVDPSDIVSVPTDYNFEKIRCTKYKIVKLVSTTISGLTDFNFSSERLKEFNEDFVEARVICGRNGSIVEVR